MLNFFKDINLNSQENLITKEITKEIKSRLSFLIDVGLEYLTLIEKAVLQVAKRKELN